MKEILRYLTRFFGFDVVRYAPPRYNYIKIDDTLNLYETRTGKYFLPSHTPDDAVIQTIINNQVFENEIVECAKRYIKKNTIVLDVGANFGQMSILFSELVKPNGKVYSFDADDFIFEIFKKNIEINNCKNITPIFGAVYNKNNETLYFPKQDFVKFKSYGSYGIDQRATEGRSVQSITIDSLNIQDEISFMKIDIQGADLQAMQGCIKTIKKNKMPILFEFEYLLQDDFKLDFQEYVDFVASIDYRFERIIYGHNFLILPQ